MVLDSRREEKVADDLQTNAQPFGRIDLEDGGFIETLHDEGTGEPYYRTCSRGGAICRYSSDFWQALIYAQYY